MHTEPATGATRARKMREQGDMLEAHARKLARLRRSRAVSPAIVAGERRIGTMRLLLTGTLLLALALHWLR